MLIFATLMRCYNKMKTSEELTPKLGHAIPVIQQRSQERLEDITRSESYLMATFLDPGFEMNVFANQVQKEKSKAVCLDRQPKDEL